ncbi:unnamed protein product [Gongylonema pulchrum]|uniref:PWWP domain-containing protein n=1 Tax=Gongylonema pulchrum TaxID=637853 RepID=A0A183EAL6_9BILA|nr:unnamed protein product [Gongylonema pulchrum]
MTPENLKKCSLWWKGLTWLSKDKKAWPPRIFEEDKELSGTEDEQPKEMTVIDSVIDEIQKDTWISSS